MKIGDRVMVQVAAGKIPGTVEDVFRNGTLMRIETDKPFRAASHMIKTGKSMGTRIITTVGSKIVSKIEE